MGASYTTLIYFSRGFRFSHIFQIFRLSIKIKSWSALTDTKVCFKSILIHNLYTGCEHFSFFLLLALLRYNTPYVHTEDMTTLVGGMTISD
jgi:hypothetical protein